MKKLLILGGTSASVGIIKEARELGNIYVVVADDRESGPAKELADEAVLISTTDVERLSKFVQDRKIDGVFCGPTEFNLMNVMNLCEKTGLPFYASRQQWNQCSNKQSFRKMCQEYGIPCAPEYKFTSVLEKQEKIDFPVIIKPVDGNSSKGIRICHNMEELKNAYDFAMNYSDLKEVVIEKYIIGNYGVVCRYIVADGTPYLLAVNDNYTVDTSDGQIMITGASVFPSKRIDSFIKEIHPRVQNMIKGLKIKNGIVFMQGKVDSSSETIYFHDMGLRLSGGQIYSIYKKLYGFSDMQTMIKFQLGETLDDKSKLYSVDPHFDGKIIGNLSIPLNSGVVSKITGIDIIKNDEAVFDVLQYYHVGDKVEEDYIGTLMQLFCRIRFIAYSYSDLAEKMEYYQNILKITDQNGEDMVYKRFDVNRLL